MIEISFIEKRSPLQLCIAVKLTQSVYSKLKIIHLKDLSSKF